MHILYAVISKYLWNFLVKFYKALTVILVKGENKDRDK